MEPPGRCITYGDKDIKHGIDGLKDTSKKTSQYQDQSNKRNRANNSQSTTEGFWN